MRYLLLTFPTPVLVLLIVGGSALLSVAVTYFVRTRMSEQEHVANNEVAGFILAAVGAVYGVLLAFMVLVVWQAYEEAQQTVEQEANTLVDIYRLGQALPEPYQSQIRDYTVEYAHEVIEDEWSRLESGSHSSQVDATVEKLWSVHLAIHSGQVPPDSHDDQLFRSLGDLGNERRIRLLDSRLDLPGLMYLLLISGGIVTIGFTLFLRAPNPVPHLLMAGLFAGLIAFVLLLIIELDNPFAGEVKINPVAFQQALELFESLRGN